MGSDAQERVVLEKDPVSRVAHLTIVNEEKRNTYDPAMRRRMGECLDDVAADDDIKVLVLRGAGGVFTTGADMNNAYAWYGGGESSRRPSQRGG